VNTLIANFFILQIFVSMVRHW